MGAYRLRTNRIGTCGVWYPMQVSVAKPSLRSSGKIRTSCVVCGEEVAVTLRITFSLPIVIGVLYSNFTLAGECGDRGTKAGAVCGLKEDESRHRGSRWETGT